MAVRLERLPLEGLVLHDAERAGGGDRHLHVGEDLALHERARGLGRQRGEHALGHAGGGGDSP